MEEERINDNNTLYLQDLKFIIFTDVFLIFVTTLKGSITSISLVKKQTDKGICLCFLTSNPALFFYYWKRRQEHCRTMIGSERMEVLDQEWVQGSLCPIWSMFLGPLLSVGKGVFPEASFSSPYRELSRPLPPFLGSKAPLLFGPPAQTPFPFMRTHSLCLLQIRHS